MIDTGAVSFSQGEILVIGAMLGAVVSGLGLMFQRLLASKDAQIASAERREKEALDREEVWRQIAVEATGVAARTSDTSHRLAGSTTR